MVLGLAAFSPAVGYLQQPRENNVQYVTAVALANSARLRDEINELLASRRPLLPPVAGVERALPAAPPAASVTLSGPGRE